MPVYAGMHQPRSWSNAEAPQNMSAASATPSNDQPLKSWLKDVASVNMAIIFVAELRSQSLRGRLNDPAL